MRLNFGKYHGEEIAELAKIGQSADYLRWAFKKDEEKRQAQGSGFLTDELRSAIAMQLATPETQGVLQRFDAKRSKKDWD